MVAKHPTRETRRAPSSGQASAGPAGASVQRTKQALRGAGTFAEGEAMLSPEGAPDDPGPGSSRSAPMALADLVGDIAGVAPTRRARYEVSGIEVEPKVTGADDTATAIARAQALAPAMREALAPQAEMGARAWLERRGPSPCGDVLNGSAKVFERDGVSLEMLHAKGALRWPEVEWAAIVAATKLDTSRVEGLELSATLTDFAQSAPDQAQWSRFADDQRAAIVAILTEHGARIAEEQHRIHGSSTAFAPALQAALQAAFDADPRVAARGCATISVGAFRPQEIARAIKGLGAEDAPGRVPVPVQFFPWVPLRFDGLPTLAGTRGQVFFEALTDAQPEPGDALAGALQDPLRDALGEALRQIIDVAANDGDALPIALGLEAGLRGAIDSAAAAHGYHFAGLGDVRVVLPGAQYKLAQFAALLPSKTRRDDGAAAHEHGPGSLTVAAATDAETTAVERDGRGLYSDALDDRLAQGTSLAEAGHEAARTPIVSGSGSRATTQLPELVHLPGVDATRPDETTRPSHRRAVAIGVNAYQTLKPLQGPIADASAMASLQRGRGAEAELVTDPVAADVKRSLEAGAKASQAEDHLFLYYSGHGLAGASGGLTGVDSSAAGPVVPWADVLGLAKDAAARDVDVELVVDSCHSGELTRSLRESFGSDRTKASTGGVRAQGIAKLADHIEALERFVTPGTFEEHKAALADRLARELLPALHFYGCGTPETSAAILGSHAAYRSWSIRTMLALDASLATTLAGPER